MAKRGRSRANVPKTCRECPNWGDVSKKVRVHELLEKTLGKFETKIGQQDFEPTVAEYVKLLQLGQELGQDDEAKEIKVTWVTPDTASESEK